MPARLEPRKDGFAVCGDLQAAWVPALYRDARQQLAGSGPLTVDLAQVERADSAGVALLVEWLRQARAQGRELRLVHLPQQMRSIIRVAGLERLLPLEGAGLPVTPLAPAYPSSTDTIQPS